MSTIISSDAKIAQSFVGRSSNEVSESVNNLVSGRKLNANVADFSVGTVLKTKVATLRTATLNAGQAKSLLETAKGGLNTIVDLLTQQKGLAVKSSDDSLSNNERGFLNQEFQSLTAEIDRISSNTNFNGKALLDGSISGVATGATATGFTSANTQYGLLDAAQYQLAGTLGTSGPIDTTVDATNNTDAGTVGADDPNTISAFGFTAVAATDIGTTKGSAYLSVETLAIDYGNAANDTVTVTIGGAATAAIDISSIGNETGAGDNNDLLGDLIFAGLLAEQETGQDEFNQFSFTNAGNGNILVETVNANDATAEGVTFQVDFEPGVGGGDATFGAIDAGGSDVDANTSTIATATGATTGTDRGDDGLATADAVFDNNLQGSFGEFSYSIDTSLNKNRITLQVGINGKTYTSNAIDLVGNDGVNGNGNILDASTNLVFFNADGARDTNGTLTESGFQLNIGTSQTFGGATDTIEELNDGLNDFVEALDTQLANVSIVQERAVTLSTVGTTVGTAGESALTGVQGTVLDGLDGLVVDEGDYTAGSEAPDVSVRLDNFGSDGSFNNIGTFAFDRNTGILSTTINDVVFSADLTDNTSDGTSVLDTDIGYSGTAYVASTGVVTTDGVIVLNSATEGDADQVRINLADLGDDITINSADAESGFESALNALFGVADAGSLNFQVGQSSSDSIGVSIGSALTSGLYKDSDDVTQSLSITTLANAQAASDIIDNAINTAISLIADVDAAITTFDSAIANNASSIQNSDAARSVLLDTDYSEESTKFAEARVKVDAASAVLSQVNSRIQNLLQLLQN